MAPPLAELTAHAQTLTSAGDLVGARRVLATVLDPTDADPRRATADLAVAAALHARILIALGDPQAARIWAGFAHAAQDRLHGPRDERTVAAAATHAAVLHRLGHHGRAAEVYRQLVGDLTELDGPDAPRTLAAEADLATAEHAAGQCTTARSRLADAWRRHRLRYGDAAPAGIKMLARLGAMERDCGRDAAAGEHLARAQELCARHLRADHPLVHQVARLAAARASGRHLCGRLAQPAWSGDAPGVTVVGPAGVRAVPVPGDPTAGHAVPDTSPRHTTGRHARNDAAPPIPGQRLGGYRTDEPATEAQTVPDAPPVPDTQTVPARSQSLLPVPVAGPTAAAPATRRRLPLVLAAVLVTGVAAAAAVVLLTLPDIGGTAGPTARESTGPTATSAAAAPPAARASASSPGAPEAVKLRDNRDNVVLNWTYPPGAEGPVLISGGRVGQLQRAFQQLPAGSGNYVVYGLNDTQNYCFTVAVVYATDRIAGSAPVCTQR